MTAKTRQAFSGKIYRVKRIENMKDHDRRAVWRMGVKLKYGGDRIWGPMPAIVAQTYYESADPNHVFEHWAVGQSITFIAQLQKADKKAKDHKGVRFYSNPTCAKMIERNNYDVK